MLNQIYYLFSLQKILLTQMQYVLHTICGMMFYTANDSKNVVHHMKLSLMHIDSSIIL